MRQKKILAIRPNEIDIRLLLQLSVFTIHGTDNSLDQLINNNKFLSQFVVPKSSKSTIRKELKLLGIRESNIFPDLNHLASEIGSTKFKTRQDKASNQEGLPKIDGISYVHLERST